MIHHLKFVKLFGWPDSRKQKQLRAIDNTSTKDHLFSRSDISHRSIFVNHLDPICVQILFEKYLEIYERCIRTFDSHVDIFYHREWYSGDYLSLTLVKNHQVPSFTLLCLIIVYKYDIDRILHSNLIFATN